MKKESITNRIATNADGEAVREIVFAVLNEYGLKPDIAGIDRDLFDIEKNYLERGGVFEVLVDESDMVVGTVGLYPIDEDIIELRKMYFKKEIRGMGLGKKTLRRMIETSKALGFKLLALETASPLVEAIGLYRSFGFEPFEGIHADRCDQAFFLNL